MSPFIDRTTTRRIASALGILGLAACAATTTTTPETTTEHEGTSSAIAEALNAKNIDTTSQLFSITDPANFPLYVSNGRGYQLTCTNSTVGLANLITGTGWPTTLQPPSTTLTDPTVAKLLGKDFPTMTDLGTLPCDFAPNHGVLRSLRTDTDLKYLLDMNELDANNRFILRNVGCGELLRAMGLDLRTAAVTDPNDVCANGSNCLNRHYVADDKYDINCINGKAPSDFVPKLSTPNGGTNQQVDRGSSIGPVTFTFDNLNPGETATLMVDPLKDGCGFFKINGSTGGATVTGRVDTTLTSQTCTTSFYGHVTLAGAANAGDAGAGDAGDGGDGGAGSGTFDTAAVQVTIDMGFPIDANNCPAKGVKCAALANTTAQCLAPASTPDKFACVYACVNAGFADCDGDLNKPGVTNPTGCEVNVQTDLGNCGGCGKTCGGPNMDATCSAGACTQSCKSGWLDCTSAPGCESNISADKTCGACPQSNDTVPHDCTAIPPPPHGKEGCGVGSDMRLACTLSCPDPSWQNCDGVASNGCEAHIGDTTNCGACGNACSNPANGVAACINSACGLGGCNSGYGNCDGNSANGCESYLPGDSNNCGGCGIRCGAQTNANSSSCQSSTCQPNCNYGYADCNSAPGCETNIWQGDVNNCGACGHRCGPQPNAASSTCFWETCEPVCNAGYGDCTSAPGCETSLNWDRNNCGSCGHACPAGQVCSSGSCQNPPPACNYQNCGHKGPGWYCDGDDCTYDFCAAHPNKCPNRP